MCFYVNIVVCICIYICFVGVLCAADMDLHVIDTGAGVCLPVCVCGPVSVSVSMSVGLS